MTPALFKATRETLGLSVAWLARRWGVRRQSVDRWESGERSIPDAIALDLQSLDAYTLSTIHEQIEEGAETLTVPQSSGEEGDQMPPAWYRMVAKRVTEQTGARVLYEGQDDPGWELLLPTARVSPDTPVVPFD